jgi:hypothetical protein
MLEKVVNLNQWISIRDQKPLEGQLVLITDGKLIEACEHWDPKWKRIFGDDEITHWMPLPALPGKENETHDKRTI